MPKKFTKSASRSKQRASKPVARHSVLYYRLHALLGTVQVIAAFEDQLCTLLHEMKTSHSPSEDVVQELHDLLADLPLLEYEHELDALHAALPNQSSSQVRSRSRSSRSAQSATKKLSRRGAKPK